MLKPGVWDSDLYNQDWKSLEDLKTTLTMTARVMYGNKPIVWILYRHNLKTELSKQVLKNKLIKISSPSFSMTPHFKERVSRYFGKKNKKQTPKKVINTEIRDVILVKY